MLKIIHVSIQNRGDLVYGIMLAEFLRVKKCILGTSYQIFFKKKMQNEATHAILETVSGSAKMALLPMICYNFEIFLQNFIMAC